ncbi:MULTISPECIES: flagellin [unclassified Yoonia]|uniref:flagellin n=1 Tax=unclassified Yoonia TaxID=2629118 RepID=UPI002AFFEC35|nr:MULTISPECIES: flagellin [unclassified Yoonia]
MAVTSIGDAAQHFLSMRAGTALKSDLAQLSESLSSGRVTDISRHLRGETAQFSGLHHKLAQLDGYAQVARETGQILDGVQQALARVDTTRAQLTDQLLLAKDTRAQVDVAARAARAGLDTMVSALNMRVADRSLLGGRDLDTTPLMSADAMITQVQATLGPDRSFAAITAAISDWFDDPAGGFAAFGYRGDAGGVIQRQIAEGRQVDIAARADDPAIRDILKATVLAAITVDLPGLAVEVKSDLVQAAGTQLFGAVSGLASMQARIGGAQAQLAEARAETTAQATGLKMAVNDLVSADPLDTAARLKAVQLQLETHYTMVGRLSQLSLLRFI